MAPRTVCAGFWLLVLSSPGSAWAEDPFCLDPRTRLPEETATRELSRMIEAADPEAMRVVVGRWYSETRNPATGQISYLYQTFEPSGLYSYANRVCGVGGCSDYRGVGQFGVRSIGPGAIFGLMTISDLQRDHVCMPLQGRLQGRDTFVTSGGATWQRAR